MTSPLSGRAMWQSDGPAMTPRCEIISPAGFERYFEEAAELFATACGVPDRQLIRALAVRCGLSFDFTWVSELIERYGLTPPHHNRSEPQ